MKYLWHWQGHTVLSNIGLVWQGFVSLMLSDDYFVSISVFLFLCLAQRVFVTACGLLLHQFFKVIQLPLGLSAALIGMFHSNHTM